jgi:hypothetical protein
MRPVRTTAFLSAAAVAIAITVAGCSAGPDPTVLHQPAAAAPPAPNALSAAPDRAPTPTPAPVAPAVTAPKVAPAASAPEPARARLYFSTPQAAMRYLAAAYNRNDLVALGHVTTPIARANLVAMRRTATNLQLLGCTPNSGGDFACSFTHDYPASLHVSGTGHAHFTAAPADEHGWYMTVLDDCN